jgi:hypothetical protein
MEPASHNRFYLSPYYPVFRSRMVMIGHPGRRECVRNGLFASRSAISPARRGRGLLTSLGPRLPRAGTVAARARMRRVVRAAAAAETLIEGVHARMARHGGGFRFGYVERARGRPGSVAAMPWARNRAWPAASSSARRCPAGLVRVITRPFSRQASPVGSPAE